MADTSEQRGSALLWYALGVDQVYRDLRSGRDGLTEAVAAPRLARTGPNEVRMRDTDGVWRIAVRQFVDPLILILIVAAVLSFALGSIPDATIIASAVLINAAVGFFQERKVSLIFQQLRGHLRTSATVIRGGTSRFIDARNLVPGDMVVLRQGDRVPADARIMTSTSFKANEAGLTGESMPVEKSSHGVARGGGG